MASLSNLPSATPNLEVFAAWEVARVQTHIASAESEMRARDVAHLSPLQREARALLLEELAAYRAEGVFPKNRDFDSPMPYFVDAQGVRCAMAHLLEIGGRADLVAKIARERNNAFVAELADEVELLAWLEAAGIDVAEAARVQPSYCETTTPAARFCKGAPLTVVSATIVREQRPGPDGVVGAARIRADGVAGDPRGIDPGAQMDAFVAGSVGTSVVLRLAPSMPVASRNFELLAVGADGTVQIERSQWGSSEGYVSVAKAKAIEASASNECAQILAAQDARWGEVPGGARSCSDSTIDGGCNASGAHAGSEALTLAILGAIAVWRSRRVRARF